jgi:hypothetical protein
MPRKLTTLLSAALLATVPMVAFAGGQLGGRVGGAVGGTVGGTAGIGVGGPQAGVNGSSSLGVDDRAPSSAFRRHCGRSR